MKGNGKATKAQLCWAILVVALTMPARPASMSEVVERTVFRLMNQARSKRGLPVYSSNSALFRAARFHSEDMARLNFFDHESPVPGRHEVNERVRAAGGKDGDFGENIYWCRGLEEAKVGKSVLAEWITSAEHRDTILNPDYSSAGVGAFHRGSEYWVTLVCE